MTFGTEELPCVSKNSTTTLLELNLNLLFAVGASHEFASMEVDSVSPAEPTAHPHTFC